MENSAIECTINKSQIIESHTILDVMHLIDQDTWLLIDLDNTLFQASQALGHVDWLLDEISKRMQLGMSRRDAFHSMYPLWKKTQMMTDVIPVEQALIEVIKELQKQGIIVMGVTHREPFLASETLRQVHSLGMDFLTSAPSSETFEFFGCERALYWQGILFVDTFNDKGAIFCSLLQRLNMKPKKVVFLDDKKKNVQEFSQTIAVESIDYVGVYYTAVEHGPKIYSAELAKLQLSFLQKIISNEQASSFLQNDSNPSQIKKGERAPSYLYKRISAAKWRDSLHRNTLYLPFLDEKGIKFFKRDQLHLIASWDEDDILLKILSDQLVGRLLPETDPETKEIYIYLYEGSIPFEAVVEVRHL